MKKIYNIVSVNLRTSFVELNNDLDISFIPMKYIDEHKGQVIDKDITQVNKSKGYTNFLEGDLLGSRISPCMENGKSAIVQDLENGCGYGSTEYHILRNDKTNFNLQFLHYILRSNTVLKNATNYFAGTVGQQRVSKEFLENLQIPLPPLEIQTKIANHIQVIKDEIKSLKQQAEQNQKDALNEFEKEVFNAT